MKRLVLIIFILIGTRVAFAKSWLVGDNLQNSNAQAILDSSAFLSGDTIMIIGSSTSYGTINITIPVTIIGEGMNNSYGENTKFDAINIYCSSVNISGLEADQIKLDTWAGTDTIKNVLIERCRINNGYALTMYGRPNNSYPGVFKNIHIINNAFVGAGYFSLNDVDGPFNNSLVSYDSLIIENNIFSNYTFVRYSPSGNVTGLGKVFINHNNFINGTSPVFDGTGQFMIPVTDAILTNNIFHSSNANDCGNCDFLNNLTYNNGVNDTLISTGIVAGNIIADSTPFINYTSGNFNFTHDYNLKPNSIAISNATDLTNIGTTGGIYPLSIGAGARIPEFTSINISNVAVPQIQDFYLDLEASGRRHFNATEIIAEVKYSIDTILSFGDGIVLPISSNLSISYADSVPPVVLDSGTHSITFIARDSKGAYSFPKTITFHVCTFNEVTAYYDYYLNGRNVILDAIYKNATSSLWDFGDGNNTNSQITPLVHNYDSAGTYNIILNNSNVCYADTFSNVVFIRGINSVYPNSGGNKGIVTVFITGAGFTDSTIVTLVDSANSIILNSIDSSTIIIDDGLIRTSFNLNGVNIGNYDVSIEIPLDTNFVLKNGFKVDSIQYPDLTTSLIGPSAIRLNQWTNYNLITSNNGNIDAVSAIAWLAVPKNLDVILDFQVELPTDSSFNWDTIPHYFEVDTLFNLIADYKVYSFVIPYVTSKSYYVLPIKLKRKTNQTFNILHWASRPFMINDSTQLLETVSSSGCFIDPDKLACITGALPNIPNPVLNCITQFIIAELNIVNNGCDDYTKVTVNEKIKDNFWLLGEAALSCMSSALSVWERFKTAGAIYKRAFAFAENASDGIGNISTEISCYKSLINDLTKLMNITSINSVDPNIKSGVTGAENSVFIHENSVLDYSIKFENADTATAAAQNVSLIDSIDISKIDINSFQLTAFGFADTIIIAPLGTKAFTTNLDLQPDLPIILQFTSYLNESNGILSTTFKSLDPATLEPVQNPFIGFLFPNDSTGRGEGFISFSVRMKDSVQTGDTINNKAFIYFDENEPIVTPLWTNIIDNEAPIGQVTSLTHFPGSDTILVSWNSSDIGPAGIYTHIIYYNVNGGLFRLWKYNTNLSSDFFIGLQDSTYGFYSIAIDSAYNIEEAPSLPDATLTITVGIDEIKSSVLSFSLFPNPTTNAVNINIMNDGKSKNVNLIFRDFTGRILYDQPLYLKSMNNSISIDLTKFASGIYLIELTDGVNKSHKKLIRK